MTPRAGFVQFAALQALDWLSTVWFLSRGVGEANPLIRALLLAAHGSAAALVPLKALATAMALYAWRSGRTRLQGRVNLLYAACIAWNMVAVFGASP